MKTSEKRQLKIQNIVSAGSVAETIDLEHIGRTIPLGNHALSARFRPGKLGR